MSAVQGAQPVLGDGLRPAHVVLRHVIPRILEAMVLPSALFYVMWHFVGVWPALFAALGWTGAITARRLLQSRRVPPLVMLVALSLTIRTLVSVISGSTFIYFLQPVFGTTVIALMFFGSLVFGRPLVARLASDFCPLSEEAASRHGVQRLFRGLTLLWALVLLVNAAVTSVFLMTMSANAFVTAKTFVAPLLTCTAAAVTVAWSVRVARREGLAPNRVRAHAA